MNVTAPGNAVRQESFTETPGVIASVLISFSDCLHYVMGEWSDWRVVLMAVLILPAALRIAGRTTFRFRYPLLTVIYSYCCLSAMFTPTVYATGSIGAGRIHNIIFAMFLLLLALNVVYVTGWLVQKGCLQKQKDEKGKEYFVPSDGVILPASEVEIKEGDTAFDVLKKVCAANSIQLEYTYSAGFGTYYVEGIHQLYEKDCGGKSGWLYRVNSEFPNVGCSSYELHDGDTVEFLYTCDMGDVF